MTGISPTNKYACQRLSPAAHLSPNAALIADLKILRKHREMEGGTGTPEYMSYANAISAITAWPTQLKTEHEARLVPSCDEKIGALVEQFAKEGRLSQAVQLLQNERFLAMREFTKIHGVGGATARDLYDKEGYRSLQDVREAGLYKDYLGKWLEDCEKPMNRDDVLSVSQFIMIQARKTAGWQDVEIKLEIVGGYRRGATEMTDVDVLITMPKEEGREKGFLKGLLERLKSPEKHFIPPNGILAEQHTATNRDQRANVPATMLDCLDRAFIVFAHPPCVPSRTGNLNRKRPLLIYRRVDIVIVNASAWGTALLAWTGSTQFNRDIRKVAMEKGWTLDAGGLTNEHGRDLPCPEEADVFRQLGLDFIPPHMRHADA